VLCGRASCFSDKHLWKKWASGLFDGERTRFGAFAIIQGNPQKIWAAPLENLESRRSCNCYGFVI
jgi:hypothetical protein